MGRAWRPLYATGGDADTAAARDAFNIDHVVSDRLEGGCWIAGLTEGHPPVHEGVYFDLKPVVCTAR